MRVGELLRRGTGLLLMVAWLNGCTTWKMDATIPQGLNAGRTEDKIRVTMTDGALVILQHPSMAGDTLVGTDATGSDISRIAIPLHRVHRMDYRAASAGRTIGLVGIIVGGVFFSMLVALAISCPNGGCFD